MKIMDYTNRPFSTVEKMNAALINSINSRCGPQDTLYHIGDFAFKGGHQGGTESAIYFEQQLVPKVVHVLGNHDRNNSLKNSIRYAEIWFGNRRWCLQHHPPEPDQLRTFPAEAGENEVYLVGHVHEHWTYKWIKDRLVINVGTDVWKYNPINTSELVTYADRCIKERSQDNE